MGRIKMRSVLWVGVLGTLGAMLGGCPVTGPAGTTPIEDFNIPAGATSARIRGGDDVVYVIPDQADFEYSFYLAQPGEAVAQHELIGSIPAEDFEFATGEPLLAPTTISFADDLQMGVVGFENGSFLLEPATSATAQLIAAYEVVPLEPLGEPAFNPTISPLGDRVAFETVSGRIGTGTVIPGGVLTNLTLLDNGLNPVFGFDNTLGYAEPGFDQFFVNDFATGTQTVFTINRSGFANIGTPFDAFEAGLTPGGIGSVGTFVETMPMVLDTFQTF
jgi:hypothetical protein